MCKGLLSIVNGDKKSLKQQQNWKIILTGQIRSMMEQGGVCLLNECIPGNNIVAHFGHCFQGEVAVSNICGE